MDNSNTAGTSLAMEGLMLVCVMLTVKIVMTIGRKGLTMATTKLSRSKKEEPA